MYQKGDYCSYTPQANNYHITHHGSGNELSCDQSFYSSTEFPSAAKNETAFHDIEPYSELENSHGRANITVTTQSILEKIESSQTLPKYSTLETSSALPSYSSIDYEKKGTNKKKIAVSSSKPGL